MTLQSWSQVVCGANNLHASVHVHWNKLILTFCFKSVSVGKNLTFYFYNMIWPVRILWLIEFSDHACNIFSRNLIVIRTCLIFLWLLSLFPLAENASFTEVTFVSPQSMAIIPVSVDVSCLIRIWDWCHQFACYKVIIRSSSQCAGAIT